ADILGAAIGCFHDAGAASRHHRKSRPRQPHADLAGQPVIGMVLLEAGGAEDGYARPDKVQRPEAAEQFKENLDGSPQFESTLLRPLQKANFFDMRRLLAPAGQFLIGVLRSRFAGFFRLFHSISPAQSCRWVPCFRGRPRQRLSPRSPTAAKACHPPRARHVFERSARVSYPADSVTAGLPWCYTGDLRSKPRRGRRPAPSAAPVPNGRSPDPVTLSSRHPLETSTGTFRE